MKSTNKAIERKREIRNVKGASGVKVGRVRALDYSMMAAKGVAVIGLGIAGNVRVRDLKSNSDSCGFALRGVVSRRPVNIPDVTCMSLDDALSSQDIHAIIICTENKLHEEYVQRGLEHGKHVLVEFPVALSSSKAKQLYELAEKKGLVLWEEDIALLTETHKTLKTKAEQAGIKSVNYSVSGSYNGWIEKFEESGSPFISGISSIHTMVDLFGNLKVVSGILEMKEDGYVATGCLETHSTKPIRITLSRNKSKDSFRKKSAVYEFDDGEVIDLDKLPPKPAAKQGLFMQDLNHFYQAVVEGKNDHIAHERSVRSLELAEKIDSLFKR